MKKNIVPVLLLSMTLSAISPVADTQAASNLTLSKSKITLTSGTSTTVNANKTVKWKSSNPKIATVKKLSAKKAKISAKKVGTCKITATYKKKKKTILVTVKKPSNSQITATKTPKPQVSVNPTLQPVAAPTYQPVTTSSASSTDVVSGTQAPSTENPVSTPVSTATPNSPVQISGISTKLISTDNEKVTFSITNESGYEAMFGRDFSLEKSENGQWVYVKPTIPIAFPSIALMLQNGKTYTDSFYLNAYAPLESGTYRIVKVIYVNAPIQDGTNKTPSVTTYTEFTLNENITQQPAPTTSTVTASPSAEPVVSTQKPAVTATTEPISATPTAIAEPQITPAIPATQPTKEPILPPTEPIVTLVPSSAQPTEPSVTTAPVITSTPSSVVSSGGVSAIIEGYNNGKLTYVLTNNLDHGHDIQWKDTLRIQKEVNGEWQDVEQTRFENKMPAIHTLSYGESQTYTENIADYFDLESGNYRMERTFYAATCKCAVVLDLPFEIRE